MYMEKILNYFSILFFNEKYLRMASIEAINVKER